MYYVYTGYNDPLHPAYRAWSEGHKIDLSQIFTFDGDAWHDPDLVWVKVNEFRSDVLCHTHLFSPVVRLDKPLEEYL